MLILPRWKLSVFFFLTRFLLSAERNFQFHPIWFIVTFGSFFSLFLLAGAVIVIQNNLRCIGHLKNACNKRDFYQPIKLNFPCLLHTSQFNCSDLLCLFFTKTTILFACHLINAEKNDGGVFLPLRIQLIGKSNTGTW